MQIDQQRLQYLLTHRDWSEEDEQWMDAYLRNNNLTDLNELLHRLFQADLAAQEKIDSNISARIRQGIKDRIDSDQTLQPPVRPALVRRLWPRFAAAAAFIILLGTGSFYFFSHHQQEQTRQPFSPPVASDVLPGGDKAILTLGNGSKIMLDSAANGVLTQQGNTKISKTANGELAYRSSDERSTEAAYNTLTTPRGGQYKLRLADGSDVWLNAASSIRYPTSFTGKERKVTITGEAYFEIAPDANRPFKVEKDGTEITVLGTHFNIMAYNDEGNISTTLLEGSVRVAKAGKTCLLTPGQQAVFSDNGQLTMHKNVDLEEVTAWKNGRFYFTNMNLQAIMRQVSRWYDVEVVYEGDPVATTLGGIISKKENASQLLKLLEATGKVHFRLEGKKIIVTK